MDYIKLKDNTTVTIEDGASLGNIVHISDTEDDAVEVCAAFTAENLTHVEFWNEGGEEAVGTFENLTLRSIPTRQTNEDGTVIVTISLREKTDLELRVDALEESQETQDGAIEDIASVVSDIVEG